MPLLELKKLTMRFGGLTAVNAVDFAVEKGQVFAVIGPNGAGKTTVFNAITGVYEPTEGDILFEGRALRRPFRRAVGVGVAITGLLTGILLALFSADIDGLWRSTVTMNYQDPSEPFPVGKAAGDFFRYLNAEVLAERDLNRLAGLEIARDGGNFLVRSRNTKLVLETHDKADAAQKRFEVLTALLNLAGSLRTAEDGQGKWLVRNPAGEILARAATEADARQAAQDLRDLPTAQVVEEGGRFALKVGNRTLASFSSRFEAEDVRSQAPAAPNLEIEKGDGKWLVLDDSRRNVLAVFESREKARQRLQELVIATDKVRWQLVTRASRKPLATIAVGEDIPARVRAVEEKIAKGETPDWVGIRQAQTTARIVLWCSLLLGAAMGAGGAYVVWSRARRTTDYITRNGLARTFQNIRLFPDLLVVENVLMGMDSRRRIPVWTMAIHSRRYKEDEAAATAKASELLEFVGLKGREGMLAKNLPYGDQRRLEIARALATKPTLLLLDEPAAGMNPSESVDLMHLIRKIRDTGVTVLLIEHHMKVVMGISDRIAVLQYGSKIAEGTPEEIRANPAVIEAYLGKEDVT